MPSDDNLNTSNGNTENKNFSDKIIISKYLSATPWDHVNITAKNLTLDIYPETHSNPPLPRSYSEADSIYTFDSVIRNYYPMIQSKIDLGSGEEIEKYSHETVEIPTTKEETEQVYQTLKRDQQLAREGKLTYSVFNFFGRSCSEQLQLTLEQITANTPEEALAKRSFPEQITGIIWPQWSFARAQKISTARHPQQIQKTFLPENNKNEKIFALSFFKSMAPSDVLIEKEDLPSIFSP